MAKTSTSFFERDVFRQRDNHVTGEHVILCQRPVIRRSSGEFYIRTEIVLSAPAVLATTCERSISGVYWRHGSSGSIATLSPTFTLLTLSPTSTTTPALSCPRTIGFSTTKSPILPSV